MTKLNFVSRAESNDDCEHLISTQCVMKEDGFNRLLQASK